jgi:hypothetical protein
VLAAVSLGLPVGPRLAVVPVFVAAAGLALPVPRGGDSQR